MTICRGDLWGGESLSFAAPMLVAQGDPSGWLFVVPALLVGGAIGAAATLLVVRRRWKSPVETLTRYANDLAAGQRGPMSVPAAAFEVRRLSEQIGRVAESSDVRLAQSNERSANLKLLVDALPDPILVSDAQDRIVLINAPAERLLNLPPQQVIGRPFVAAVNDLAILDLFEACKKQRDDGNAFPVDREIRLLRRGQRLQFQSHAERTPRGGTLIVLRDVSTLAATLQMKTDFVANASHELRTPISAIKVAFETLGEVWRDEDPTLGTRCVTIIDGHLRRLEEMLRDLLDLSRVENPDLKPTLEPIEAGELAAVLRSIWGPVAVERKVELALPESSDVGFISDRRLLDLVLKNLVENALKFTPAGGRVSVTIGPVDDGAVRITVADTGCGIPTEHAERVFERFYQVDAARSGLPGRGTGLGLAIVKHAVGGLGGQVQLKSRLGEGTTITITLPQATT